MRNPAATMGVMKPPAARPANREQDADRVEHVVDIEAVARPLLLANARHGAVEAVTEPVDRQEHRCCDQRPRVRGGHPERDAGAEHGQRSENGQVVGAYPEREAASHPDEAAFLDSCQEAGLDSGFWRNGNVVCSHASQCENGCQRGSHDSRDTGGAAVLQERIRDRLRGHAGRRRHRSGRRRRFAARGRDAASAVDQVHPADARAPRSHHRRRTREAGARRSGRAAPRRQLPL